MKLLLRDDPALIAAEGPILYWAMAVWRACGRKARRRPQDVPIATLVTAMKEAMRMMGDAYDWQKVSGPASAMLLTCRRIGWKVISAFKVEDERARIWDFGTTSPAEFRPLVARAVAAETSRRMADKYADASLKDGIWTAPVQTALRDRSLPPHARPA